MLIGPEVVRVGKTTRMIQLGHCSRLHGRMLVPVEATVFSSDYRISELGFRCSKCVSSLVDHRLWYPIKQGVSKWQLDQVSDNSG